MSSADKQQPIRVCFIAPKAYPLLNPSVKAVFGGAEVDLYFLATELAKDRNFAVTCITADYGQQEIETIESLTVIKSVDFNKNPLIGAIRVWQGLCKADARIYMIKTISPGMFLVSLFCRLKKRAFIFRTSNTNSCDGTYLRRHPVLGGIYKWALRTAKLVLVQNQTDMAGLEETTGVSAIVIPNGQRLADLPQSSRDTILWVGRSAAIKKPDLFIELAKEIPDEKFTMICQQAMGDKNYDKLLAKAKTAGNLEFIERVRFDEIDGYFQRAKVFVNTSDAEGFPNTFIQAGRCATPILSLNVNPDDFLDKYECGVSCNGRFDRFVDSLRFMLDEGRYIEIGNKTRSYVEQNHDIKNIAEVYKSLLVNCII
jgi:glycosyltransferase involved in cell wall biosynthesis